MVAVELAFGFAGLLVALIAWLCRPVGGGMTLADWAKRGALSNVPRQERTVPFIGNGWYQVCDERELGYEPLIVECMGRRFTVKRTANDGVEVKDEKNKEWLVDRSYADMVLVWYDAEGRPPSYLTRDCAPALPKGLVYHGKLRHSVRSLLQVKGKRAKIIFNETNRTFQRLRRNQSLFCFYVFLSSKNGADLAHFKAVHEDGSKSFGLLGKLLGLRFRALSKWVFVFSFFFAKRLIFKGVWEVNAQHPVMSNAFVENHIQVSLSVFPFFCLFISH